MATQDDPEQEPEHPEQEPEREAAPAPVPEASGACSDVMSQHLATRIEHDVESPLQWRSILKKTITAVVAGITIYLVFPSLTEVFASWPKLTKTTPDRASRDHPRQETSPSPQASPAPCGGMRQIRIDQHRRSTRGCATRSIPVGAVSPTALILTTRLSFIPSRRSPFPSEKERASRPEIAPSELPRPPSARDETVHHGVSE